MVVQGVRYAYRVEVDDSAVLFEGLYSYPERRRRVLFEREDLEIHFRRGLGALAGTRELLTPTTLALSAAMRFDDPEVAALRAPSVRDPGPGCAAPRAVAETPGGCSLRARPVLDRAPVRQPRFVGTAVSFR